MEITEHEHSGISVVHLNGRMDASTTGEFDRHMLSLGEQGKLKVVLDFSGLDYISSAGLRSLLIAAKTLKANQGRLLLCGMNENVRDLFQVTGFNRILEIHPGLDTALAALGS